jgi:hypothetical protein
MNEYTRLLLAWLATTIALSLVYIAVEWFLARFGKWVVSATLRSRFAVMLVFWIPWSEVLKRYDISYDWGWLLTCGAGILVNRVWMMMERHKERAPE